MPIELQQEWGAFWAAQSLEDRLGDEYYALIAAHMSEAHRFYHSLAHVQALLRDYYEAAHLVRDKTSF